jgi:hypothetical protein
MTDRAPEPRTENGRKLLAEYDFEFRDLVTPVDATTERLLTAAILRNGIPHVGHNQLCHEADAKLVRAALVATPLPTAPPPARTPGGEG